MRIGTIPLILSAFLMTATPAQEAPRTPATTSAEGRAILHSALVELAAGLGKPAQLDVKSLRVSGEWAFVYASIQGAGGRPIDYQGTPFAEEAEAGLKSHVYAGLLRGSGEHWTLVASVVGPTDVAWTDWARQYSAPAAIFELPAD
ncbi:hypothetical protein [Dokdonella sp.]|uniref:hypothetical protein n=1 Tax=Dokdonella sp. TaxID=2291710 RepID=UPI001B20A6C9|nr:hypothetical protein [Dokdonella sp.]MBO9664707.1 hypothetical protein [Dokdonella sp.]